MILAKKIYKIIQNILVITVFVILIALATTLLLKIHPCVILSGSMMPKVQVGSVALIDTKAKNPEVGDIISYQKGEIIVTHRVVKMEKDGFITKGDNNDALDTGVVKQEQVIGTYISSIPYIGYGIVFLTGKKGIILVLLGIIAFALLGKILELSNRGAVKEFEK